MGAPEGLFNSRISWPAAGASDHWSRMVFASISPGRPSWLSTRSRTRPGDPAPQQVVLDCQSWLNCGPWSPGSTFQAAGVESTGAEGPTASDSGALPLPAQARPGLEGSVPRPHRARPRPALQQAPPQRGYGFLLSSAPPALCVTSCRRKGRTSVTQSSYLSYLLSNVNVASGVAPFQQRAD